MPCRGRSSRSKSPSKRTSKKAKAKTTKKSKIDQLEVDKDTKLILKALEKIGKPSRVGEIAKEAGMSPQKVAGKIRSIFRKGLVKRSEEGLYELSI
ncbi:MAG: hypothetical protein J7J65_02320 [Candidatus Korarchaeota archaeon]|nr:hypothetical protein [Candidatus Korarchaeota archaeon]